MSITAEAPNGLRYYLYLGLPDVEVIPADPHATENYSKAMIMLGAPWQTLLAPNLDDLDEFTGDHLSHLGWSYLSEGYVPGSIVPTVSLVTDDFYADDNYPRAAIMLGCPWQTLLAPNLPDSEDLSPDNLSHIGWGYLSESYVFVAVQPPETRDLVSSLFYETLVHGELVDTPVLFSTDRTTAWRIAVTNEGVFSTVAAPLQVAQFDFLTMFNDVTQTNDILTVNNSGEMSVALIGANQLSSNPILLSKGVAYVPDGRFPSPAGSNYPGFY